MVMQNKQRWACSFYEFKAQGLKFWAIGVGDVTPAKESEIGRCEQLARNGKEQSKSSSVGILGRRAIASSPIGKF